jgi:N utilization substance protein B
MNRKEFREEMVMILYKDIMNAEDELTIENQELLETYKDIKLHIEEIDEMIKKNLVNWSITRLNYVDLAIIRYAVYELLVLNQAKEVVMNEAIELTKKYSNLDDDSARKFNNRLLQNIVDDMSGKDV